MINDSNLINLSEPKIRQSFMDFDIFVGVEMYYAFKSRKEKIVY